MEVEAKQETENEQIKAKDEKAVALRKLEKQREGARKQADLFKDLLREELDATSRCDEKIDELQKQLLSSVKELAILDDSI